MEDYFFMKCQRGPPSLSLISYKTENIYAICAVWCVMWRVRLISCKILILWVMGRPKIPHLGSFRPFEWYSKIDPRWQSYVHFILQGLLTLKAKNLKSANFDILLKTLSVTHWFGSPTSQLINLLQWTECISLFGTAVRGMAWHNANRAQVIW